MKVEEVLVAAKECLDGARKACWDRAAEFWEMALLGEHGGFVFACLGNTLRFRNRIRMGRSVAMYKNVLRSERLGWNYSWFGLAQRSVL